LEDKLFELLDDLNIRDTNLLLDKDISLSLDRFTRKRIEKAIKKRTGYYSKSNMLIQKINNILGGIFMNRRIALSLSVGVILILGGGTYAYAKTPVAYVSVDINPSVELGVNAFDKVTSVEAYNEDGQKILEGTNLINYDIDNAVSTVISNAISNGYIHDDGSSAIEITTATDKDKVATEMEESLKDTTDKTLKNNDIIAEVETGNVALARRDEARKLGITPGKLNIIQKLQKLDPIINIEDYKSSSVKDIQKKTKELRKDNKSDEVTTDDSKNTDTKSDVVTDENTNEVTVSETVIDSDTATTAELGKSNNNSNNGKNEGKNTTTTILEKQNSSNNVNSQGNSDSQKLEKSTNSDTESKSSNSNTSKSDNNGNSNSQNNNKDKSKNN